MNRVYNITKEQLENFLIEGKTTREIAKLLCVNNCRTISRYVHYYNLQHLYEYPKYPPYHLGSIDTKEKAYMLGFIIADGSITNSKVNITICHNDKEIIELFSEILGSKYREDMKIDVEKKKHPNVKICRKITDINKFVGGNLKAERNVPIIKKDLEVYMVRGIFDADGCITWGFRKDRNRLWYKVSFTSQLSILTSIQKILYKIGISTIIRPKKGCDCFVLEFANKKDIIIFYNYLYSDKDFVPLKRKFDKYNALRLELGEFSETTIN